MLTDSFSSPYYNRNSIFLDLMKSTYKAVRHLIIGLYGKLPASKLSKLEPSQLGI